MAAIEHEWIIYSVELLSRRRAWVVFVETVDEQHVRETFRKSRSPKRFSKLSVSLLESHSGSNK